ncbi:MAG: hypothetical protein DMG64_12720 [Acidobacteria bacterium]|nr:MAG: hypothetical protein DMG63_11000 [Acidobacteriota bacterium]PYY02058.1 MAG: hypothetical protein DMG64_12720 [Acidobacteriota bacterium]PYY23855.1 MAG: hypothetical protein DMG62_06515 [Acidobacteriota bacterium]
MKLTIIPLGTISNALPRASKKVCGVGGTIQTLLRREKALEPDRDIGPHAVNEAFITKGNGREK